MLFDCSGQRKYLVSAELTAFLNAADRADPHVRSFCWTLAITGARLSEVRSLTPRSIDLMSETIVIECLKRRSRGIFRAVPIPTKLVLMLEEVHQLSKLQVDPGIRDTLLWPWCRTTAWAHVKKVCAAAQVPPSVSMPKAFRHAFGVRGTTQAGVPLGTMKRWLGHARLDSTIIYTEAVGAEERVLLKRMWL